MNKIEKIIIREKEKGKNIINITDKKEIDEIFKETLKLAKRREIFLLSNDEEKATLSYQRCNAIILICCPKDEIEKIVIF